MAKIRVTIEYDLDYDGDLQEAVTREQQDWEQGRVDVADVQATGGEVKFEIIP